MKRFIALLVMSLVLAIGAGAAQAAKPAKPAKADKAARKEAKGVTGTILKIDGTNIVVQTRGKKGGEVTVTTDAATKFQVNGKEATITDIKAGSNVVASPATGTAKTITIREAKNNRPAKGAKKNQKNA